MNEVIRQLYGRKSTRVFTDQDIEESVVQEILQAAAMAPTAGNQQLYTILRITDPALLGSLAESCDHQPFIAEGKLALVFCADCLKWYRAYQEAGCDPRLPGPGDLMLAVNDALIAAQNAVVAAESYGIGSCYIGDIMENIEIQRELLGLPELVFPAALLVFGYPTEQQKNRKKPERAELKYIVQENRYRSLDPEQLQTMMAKGKGDQEYREWMNAFCKRKYQSDFALEMNRSVGEYLKQFTSWDRQERIRRIEQYERLFDEASLSRDPEKLRLLEAYYTSGEWREDYEADERGELPPDLKRGVLSQDALYNLLEG